MFGTLNLVVPWDQVANDEVVARAVTDMLVGTLDARESDTDLLAALKRIDMGRLDAEQRANVATAWTRLSAMIAAGQQEALALLAGPDDPKGPALDFDPIVPEIGAMLGLSPARATSRVVNIRAMARLPRMMELLAAGRVHWMHAFVVAEETRLLSDAGAAQVDAQVAERAPKMSIGRVRALAARAALAIEPERAKETDEGVRQSSDVAARPLGDGFAELVAQGPAADIAQIMAMVNRAADLLRRQQPDLFAGMARLLALRNLVSHGTDSTDACPNCAQIIDAQQRASRKRRARTQVVVTVPSDVLDGSSDAPAVLEGYGPISADEARRLAFTNNPVWRRLVYDPVSGIALDYGRDTYHPPDALAEFARARAGGCAGITCHHPAGTAEIDHNLGWSDGGTTTIANLAPKCERWHDSKTHDGWQVVETPDGVLRWTSPLGQTYDRALEDYRPVTSAPQATEPHHEASQLDDTPPF